MCFEISGHASTLGGRALFTISTSDDDRSDAAVFERPPDRNSGFTIDAAVTLSLLDSTSTPFAASFPGDSLCFARLSVAAATGFRTVATTSDVNTTMKYTMLRHVQTAM
jgi:hypothetical protein